MIYLKWFVLAAVKMIVMFPTLLIAPQLIALWTRPMPHDLPIYTWGWLWGTFDNPPQGDEGFGAKHAFFTGIEDGWRGYINRVQWMWRNKLYGFNRMVSLKYNPEHRLEFTGNENISDKYKIPGRYFAKLYDGKKLVGFEFYLVRPWSDKRDLRVRIGWKMMSDKFAEDGFAPLVTTGNPFDGYGKD